MQDTENEKQHYSEIARVFFAVFGIACLLVFISEVFRAFTEGKANLLIMASFIGFLGYVFSYAAYKGKAPSWYEDKSFFKSNGKTNQGDSHE